MLYKEVVVDEDDACFVRADKAGIIFIDHDFLV
jgi:hypothetical protein